MTYQPKLYRKQGGDELLCSTGGVISTTAGGTHKRAVVHASTGGTIRARDVLVASSTGSTGVGAYALPNPGGPGRVLDVVCPTSTGGVTVTSAGAVISIGSTVQGTVLTFKGGGLHAHLVSISTGRWIGIKSSTNVRCT